MNPAAAGSRLSANARLPRRPTPTLRTRPTTPTLRTRTTRRLSAEEEEVPKAQVSQGQQEGRQEEARREEGPEKEAEGSEEEGRRQGRARQEEAGAEGERSALLERPTSLPPSHRRRQPPEREWSPSRQALGLLAAHPQPPTQNGRTDPLPPHTHNTTNRKGLRRSR